MLPYKILEKLDRTERQQENHLSITNHI